MVKRYLIDQLFILMVGIGILFIIPDMCGHVFILIIIFGIIDILSFGYLCRRILIFPIDLVLDKRKEDVYFSKVCNIDNYELYFPPRKYYCEWEFYSENEILEVLVPIVLTEKEIINMEKPDENQLVRIYYYRYSKILYSWEVLYKN